MWPSAWDPTAWKVIGAYMAFELALMRLVPGKTFTAMVTATGHVPKYTANGMQCYALSIAALMYLMHEGTLAPGAVYDLFGKLLSSMNVFALLFCCALMLKGYTFPSTADSGSTGVLVLDYYWGTELYPRVLGWDVKTFTNCRFGMMFWALGLLCYAHAQFLKCAAAPRPSRIYARRTAPSLLIASSPAQVRPRLVVHGGERRAPARVHHQVLLVGDRLLVLDGHPARPRGLLHLLGLPRVASHHLHRAHVSEKGRPPARRAG